MPKKLHIHPALKRGYGWKRSLPDHRWPKFEPHFLEDLPASIDLRSQCPAVYDQADLGSCTANAWGGCGEFLMIKNGQTAYVPSRLFIYYNERVLEGTIREDSGASLSDGARVVSQQGFPHESLWWYNTGKFSVKPNKKVFTDGVAHLGQGVARVNQTKEDMQRTLAGGLPIVIGFSVYESFESQKVADSGIVPMPKSNEEILGGHAVLVVGYDDSKNWWVVRNSWGTSWGDKGYFYMPYEYLLNPDLSDDFWTAVGVA